MRVAVVQRLLRHLLNRLRGLSSIGAVGLMKAGSGHIPQDGFALAEPPYAIRAVGS